MSVCFWGVHVQCAKCCVLRMLSLRKQQPQARSGWLVTSLLVFGFVCVQLLAGRLASLLAHLFVCEDGWCGWLPLLTEQALPSCKSSDGEFLENVSRIVGSEVLLVSITALQKALVLFVSLRGAAILFFRHEARKCPDIK